MQNSPKSTKIIVYIVLLLLVITGSLSVIYRLNEAYFNDLFGSMGYEPTSEMVEIRERLNLTERARLTFAASRPVLEERTEFNNHCNSHNEEISVLGCYYSGHIYLYNVQAEELAGVKESTAAHELLHAVWERMSAADKSEISKALLEVYYDEKYHDFLKEDLEVYENDETIDELHSRVGTEIAELPKVLEDHYATVFKDQDEIVDYYDNYIEPFKELSDEIDNLAEQMDVLDTEITAKTNNYYARANALSAQIDNFNSCANRAGCFSSDAEFNRQRNQLLAEQSALDDLYQEISDLIDEYNALVAEYNGNILRSETLESLINSNASEKIIEGKE